jgi:hypothetical protein
VAVVEGIRILAAHRAVLVAVMMLNLADKAALTLGKVLNLLNHIILRVVVQLFMTVQVVLLGLVVEIITVQEVRVAEPTVAQDTQVTVAELQVGAVTVQAVQVGCIQLTQVEAVVVPAFVEAVVAVEM